MEATAGFHFSSVLDALGRPRLITSVRWNRIYVKQSSTHTKVMKWKCAQQTTKSCPSAKEILRSEIRSMLDWRSMLRWLIVLYVWAAVGAGIGALIGAFMNDWTTGLFAGMVCGILAAPTFPRRATPRG